MCEGFIPFQIGVSIT